MLVPGTIYIRLLPGLHNHLTWEPVLRHSRQMLAVLRHSRQMLAVLRHSRQMRVSVLYHSHRLLARIPSHSRLRRSGLVKLSLSSHAAGCKPPGIQECTPRSQ